MKNQMSCDTLRAGGFWWRRREFVCMMRIAVVENEEIYVEELVEFIRTWERENDLKEKCEVRSFKSGETFLEDDIDSYSAVFMDIQLDGTLDGMNVARQIRRRGGTQMIFFLTAYDNYVLDGYDVDASGYLLKPVEYEKIEKCMNKVLQRTRKRYFEHVSKGKRCLIPYDDILYFQSSLHYIEIKTLD
ncbi:MAG: LytTR family DNA-binding domain-containing protein, partial [Elusimicrobiales bacterium]|nr:LytTR family DNA-binding domain-containing protein [Elusimicrobiales bacterium]